ncbi:hypothetical protein BAUCODRAFT_75302 [Baudoinia panamericana UAMH 10762]|uniref:Response regulatory domain-containing protein n=1 Tax=Baudoinia panamericana (strain UAMH 10762) TaxID=717646 RepID=M2MQX3_BAUPA|nr:uncharacterized protein BAUCODRAFT_75302 [Baudoinia panamericana UAMH 10762]EMC93878.1 hypothetical protein BAUCODRAFT_75302 [Baudoinia panamericana UAMH 10762]
MAHMLNRKIWVRRPGASATLVQIREDDLVDDVREMILKKYANSLGRTFDAPDMTLRIVQRAEQGQPRHERQLGPEEEMCRTIDSYYPGGQTVEDALVIDVPQRRTPRPSPRAYQQAGYQALDDYRPLENGTDYFPPMPAVVPGSIAQTSNSNDGRAGVQQHHPSTAAPLEPHQRSISVLNTGQLPPLPSPGGGRRGHRDHRPKYQRQHTSSPTIVTHASAPPGHNPGVVAIGVPGSANSSSMHPLVHRQTTRPRNDSLASDGHHPTNGLSAAVPAAQPPTPPAPDTLTAHQAVSNPPTPSSGSTPVNAQHRARPRKNRKTTPEKSASGSRHRREDNQTANGVPPMPTASSMLDGSVPPINVLIVEDNIINLRILEGLMKRLKVRWQTAMNGQIAVDKWRGGGYHLVLMDIQMPVMNGLQATKEIRRLERVNGIGVFSADSATPSPVEERKRNSEADTNGGSTSEPTVNGDAKGKDKVSDDKLAINDGLFKSPVIIVALTASSLQSDRHEALAAGCNDFLTKPVNFVWLERKVKEWGCMQALIDFDGWRRWKDYAAKAEAGKSEEQKMKEEEQERKEKVKMEKLAKLQEKQRAKQQKEEEEKRKKGMSLGSSDVGTAATGNGTVQGAEPPVVAIGHVGAASEG